MSPNSAFVVIGVATIDGAEKVWVDTLHTTQTRAETRIKKLREKHPQTPFAFTVEATHFGHRVAPLYTNAKTDDRGVPSAKAPVAELFPAEPATSSRSTSEQLTELLRQVIVLQHQALKK